jgi:hypothetical protein
MWLTGAGRGSSTTSVASQPASSLRQDPARLGARGLGAMGYEMGSWCRACGAAMPPGHRAPDCAQCGVSLRLPPVVDSRIGLIFEVKGRLRVNKRRCICIAEQNGAITVHLDSDDTREVGLDEVGAPLEIIPGHLSPAGRLVYSSRLSSTYTKAHWDNGTLLDLAGGLLRDDVAARRQLANESLEHDWSDIFEWLFLSPSEKAWIKAHEASKQCDIDVLLAMLSQLPPSGYDARIGLILPHLSLVRERQSDWLQLLRQWQEGAVLGVEELASLLGPDINLALGSGVDLLAALGADDRAGYWRSVQTSFLEERPGSSPSEAAAHWAAVQAFQEGLTGTDPTYNAAVKLLTRPLLDDLIEAGSLAFGSRLETLSPEAQAYVCARTGPWLLDEKGLRAAGHTVELARRFFLQRDRTRLEALPDADGIRHYQALLDVVDGVEPDAARLRSDEHERLVLAFRARRAIEQGEVHSLPSPVLRDATLWPLYGDLAREGRLLLDVDERSAYPDFGEWADMERLVGLIWEWRWEDAVHLGQTLIKRLQVERYADEALNLTAFACYQLGRDLEALSLLEQALDGAYTTNLLINTSLLASQLKPAESAHHFARLIQDAPSPELQTAAMIRAIGVWEQSDATASFPSELRGPLETVLTNGCHLPEYVRIARVAAAHAPDVLIHSPDPGGERSAAHRMHAARARFFSEAQFRARDLVEEVVAVHNAVGRPAWFNADWHQMVDGFRAATFVPFGEGVEAANFWDSVYLQAPQLLDLLDRAVMLPQAGTHLALHFANEGQWLSPQAFSKFFFTPADELAHGELGDGTSLHFVADNLSKTLFLAAVSLCTQARESSAKSYNPLAQRFNWDSENRWNIRQKMIAVLDADDEQVRLADHALQRLQRLPLTDETHHERVSRLASAVADWRAENHQLRSQLGV